MKYAWNFYWSGLLLKCIVFNRLFHVYFVYDLFSNNDFVSHIPYMMFSYIGLNYCLNVLYLTV